MEHSLAVHLPFLQEVLSDFVLDDTGQVIGWLSDGYDYESLIEYAFAFEFWVSV